VRPERIPVRSVVPAVLTPFNDDLAIDHDAYARHIEEVSSIDGVTAIMVNGASMQDSVLTRDDRSRLLGEAIAASGGKTPIIGAVRESDIESDIGVLARDAEESGAEAILIMPPKRKEDTTVDGALKRFSKVFDQSTLPVAFYQVNPNGFGYPVETMAALAREERVFAVKEGSGDPVTSEKDARAMRDADPEIAIWTTHSRWLLGDLAIGADGLLSGMGSISADLHVAICRAMWSSNLKVAREVSDVLFRLTQVFYAPGQNAHTRMKYALKQLGRLAHDHVRPPLKPLDQAEKDRIEAVLEDLR
jgi:4-hydroxy-tetrahydrodipicolinate synthase